jgi:catechol 2,3-dioxygenase-like lactoylglutathione lyase family enzyme
MGLSVNTERSPESRLQQGRVIRIRGGVGHHRHGREAGGEISMDAVIAELVNRFERGGITRRELIQGLSALVAVSSTSSPVWAQSGGLNATGIDHTSVLVTDLQRSSEFYQRVFGLRPVSEDKPNRILRLGASGNGPGATLVSLRQQKPPGLIDHFAISVENFDRDRVTAILKQHGLTPTQNIEFGFHVKDPDGAVVQVV